MKILMFLLPVVIAGVVLGLAMSGTIQIPGISPKRKAAATRTEDKPQTAEKKAPAAPTPKNDPPKDEADRAKGETAVAKLWNEMEIPALTTLTASWSEEDLAPILSKMAPDKTVEYLAALVKPNDKGEVDQKSVARAATLTKLIQDLASRGQG